ADRGARRGDCRARTGGRRLRGVYLPGTRELERERQLPVLGGLRRRDRGLVAPLHRVGGISRRLPTLEADPEERARVLAGRRRVECLPAAVRGARVLVVGLAVVDPGTSGRLGAREGRLDLLAERERHVVLRRGDRERRQREHLERLRIPRAGAAL